MTNFGMCFSKSIKEENPLSHIGKKRPTYLELFTLCENQGWNVFAVSKKTYQGKGIFNGVWAFNNGEFKQVFEKTKMDLVFDWTNGLEFPPEEDPKMRVVDSQKFKVFCSNKWEMYLILRQFMATTYWVGEDNFNLKKILTKIKGDKVVLKPISGLKGKGIFVGEKNEALKFKFEGKNPHYIAQEFVDTSGGIKGITDGRHDLRVVVNNKKVVWCHVRTPRPGTYKANVGQGGSLTEVDYNLVPDKVKKIVEEVSEIFYKEFDNPLFSVDFGIEKGHPYIFEINDQIGFPLPDAKGREKFLQELVENFKSKVKK
ncbi:MAG TPA: ATP-grasp domain-containing protein [Patescibacteria group bacterium]